MNTQKITNILVLGLLMLSVMPFAVAEETTGATEQVFDSETTIEVRSMINTNGAEIRFLQLEIALAKNILKGEALIEAFNQVEQDTIALEKILNELEVLEAEVEKADYDSENVAETFVAFKQEAKDLIKSFRETTREMRQSLTNKQLKELRATFEEINSEINSQVKEIREKIRTKSRIHNVGKFGKVQGILGDKHDELLIKFKNGEITLEELKEKMRLSISNMEEESRRDFYVKAKEENLRRGVFARAAGERVREFRQQRIPQQ